MDNLMEIKHLMKDHNESDDRRFKELGEATKQINDDIKTIKDNHLYHLELSLAKLSTDVSWVKKILWFVVTTSVGGLVASVINLIQ